MDQNLENTQTPQHKRLLNPSVQNSQSLKVATTGILAALGVVLSYLNPFGYITLFGAKINPFAHFINAIAGVLLGPTYGVICALIIASIRYYAGIGSILAFPGGMSGALIVGLSRNLMIKLLKDRLSPKKLNYAALTEFIGTVFIGATISHFIIPVPMLTFWWLFALSCVPGSILGWMVLETLRGTSYYEYFIPELFRSENDIAAS